ncbi:hypothetical protein FA13DRAFT_1733487, partial [Coprinellus micaceus]
MATLRAAKLETHDVPAWRLWAEHRRIQTATASNKRRGYCKKMESLSTRNAPHLQHPYLPRTSEPPSATAQHSISHHPPTDISRQRHGLSLYPSYRLIDPGTMRDIFVQPGPVSIARSPTPRFPPHIIISLSDHTLNGLSYVVTPILYFVYSL